jgi:hypothetical protein
MGGGGGTKQVDQRYDSLEALYDQQAQSAALLRGLAEKNLPGATTSYMQAVNEVMSPLYREEQAVRAREDSLAAAATEREAADRSLSSMGVNPNDARFVSANRATELSNAARTAASANIARNEARDYQRAVAQDAVGTFTGQSNSAATQSAMASNGLASLANSRAAQQQQQQSNTSNNIASAIGGGMAAYSLYNNNKGGKVPHAMAGRVERHAGGGFVGAQQATQQGFFTPVAPAPVYSPQPQQPQQQQQQNPLAQGVSTYKQVKALGEQLGVGGKQAPAPVVEKSFEAAAPGVETAPVDMTVAPQTAELAPLSSAPEATAPVTGAADMTGTAGAGAGAAGAAEMGSAAAALAGAEGGTTALGIGAGAAEAAAATAATEAAAAGAGAAAAGGAASGAATGATAGTSVGPIGTVIGAAIGAIAGALMSADGGKMERRKTKRAARRPETGVVIASAPPSDMSDVGRVPGQWMPPAGEDTVFAMLKPSETVVNAEATKLVGDEALAALNAKGLAQRRQGRTPEDIRTVGLAALIA